MLPPISAPQGGPNSVSVEMLTDQELHQAALYRPDAAIEARRRAVMASSRQAMPFGLVSPGDFEGSMAQMSALRRMDAPAASAVPPPIPAAEFGPPQGPALPSTQPAAATPVASPVPPPASGLDVPGNRESLLDFGLRLMQSGEATPGTMVGPSFFGAVGQAGMGTMESRLAREKAAAAQAWERQKHQDLMDLGYAKLAKPGGPQSPLAKLRADLEAGRISQADYDAARAKFLRDANADRAITPAQEANNSEIDQARARLRDLEKNLPPGTTLSDELHNRMSRVNPATGRLEPDYSSYWGRLGWLAQQHKVGDDPDQSEWSRNLMMPPEPATMPAIPRPRPEMAAPPLGEIPPPPSGYNLPAPSAGGTTSRLPPDLKARADRGETFSESELRKLYRDDPATFRALREYLERR